MVKHKLIRRIQPFQHEALTSFLMRAADTNGYRRAQDILVFALESSSTNPQVFMEQVEILADYTRTAASEIAQLTGISRRIPRTGLAWQINGEWISKFAFVLFRQAHICPQCLSENAYLRGDWSLILNTACGSHGIQLINCCPHCLKTLTANRYLPERCLCGFDLRQSPRINASPEEILFAKLVNARANPTQPLDSPCLPAYQIENLSQLSLEGLCQSLWFLGHDLYCQFPLGTGRGHRKLSREKVLQVIRGAFWILSDWPERLGITLHKIVRSPVVGDDAYPITRLFGPMQRYFERHVSSDDTRFISLPYEMYVQHIASRLGQSYRYPQSVSPQLHFKFD